MNGCKGPRPAGYMLMIDVMNSLVLEFMEPGHGIGATDINIKYAPQVIQALIKMFPHAKYEPQYLREKLGRCLAKERNIKNYNYKGVGRGQDNLKATKKRTLKREAPQESNPQENGERAKENAEPAKETKPAAKKPTGKRQSATPLQPLDLNNHWTLRRLRRISQFRRFGARTGALLWKLPYLT